MRYHPTPVRMGVTKKQQQISVGEDVRKGNSSTLLMEMWIGAVTLENSMEVPKKVKNETSIWSSKSTYAKKWKY